MEDCNLPVSPAVGVSAGTVIISFIGIPFSAIDPLNLRSCDGVTKGSQRRDATFLRARARGFRKMPVADRVQSSEQISRWLGSCLEGVLSLKADLQGGVMKPGELAVSAQKTAVAAMRAGSLLMTALVVIMAPTPLEAASGRIGIVQFAEAAVTATPLVAADRTLAEARFRVADADGSAAKPNGSRDVQTAKPHDDDKPPEGLTSTDWVRDWLARANREFQTTVIPRLSTPVPGGVAADKDAIVKKLEEVKHQDAKAAEAARRAEDALKAEKAKKAEADRQAAEEAKRIEETKRVEAEHRAAEEAKRVEEEHKAVEEARRLEDERKAADEAKRVEEERQAVEEARRIEEAKQAEDERKAAEEAKHAEDKRKAAEEAKRVAEERKAAEEAKRLDEERKAAEAARQAEEARKAAEAKQERERLEAEAARIEAQRQAAEAQRQADEAKRLEAKRLEDERARLAAEKKAEEERQAAAAAAAEAEAAKPQSQPDTTSSADTASSAVAAEKRPDTAAEPKSAAAEQGVSSGPARKKVASRKATHRSAVRGWSRRGCRYAGRRIKPPGHYVIGRGDTLWGISRRHYSRGWRYWRLYRANRSIIGNPNLIYPCQRIYVPRRR
jgi:nucleoid-associated protein YgaU